MCSNNIVSNAAAGLTNVSTTTCSASTCSVITNIDDTGKPEQSLSVSPNPFDQYIEMGFSKPASKFEISDMNGKIISQEILNGETHFTFNTSAFSAGFYLIKITYVTGSNETRKLLKM